MRTFAYPVLSCVLATFYSLPANAGCLDLLRFFTGRPATEKTFSISQDEYLRELRKTGWKPASGEGPPEKWNIDGPAYARLSYEGGFRGLFYKLKLDSEHFFENLLQARRTAGKSTNVLDLFGSGYFVENQALADSITGVRYGPFDRSKVPKEYWPKYFPEEVLGDILSPITWKKLDRSMERRGIPKMDLIVMRPEGGWESAPFTLTERQNALAFGYIVRQALTRLSDDGEFYFDLWVRHTPGDPTRNPMILKLQEEVAKYTNHELIFTKMEVGGQVQRFEGMLRPKPVK